MDTLVDTLKKFLKDLREASASKKTVAAYHADLEHFCRWLEETGGGDLLSATAIDLQEYRQHLIQRYKPATVNRRLSAMSRFYRWAGENDCIQRPPRAPRQVRREKIAPKSLTRQERNALLRAVERGGNLRDIAVVNVLLFCGLRVSELVGLTVEDLELKDKYGKITVRGKGAKYREVPVPSHVRRILRDYLTERHITGGRLFLGRRGPLTPRGIQEMLQKYAYQSRLEKASPHTLRHTCATELLKKGIDLVAVAAILGHENLNTTAIYTRPRFEDLMAAVEKE